MVFLPWVWALFYWIFSIFSSDPLQGNAINSGVSLEQKPVSPLHGVIFDMDGVLLHSEPHWRQAEIEIFPCRELLVTDDIRARADELMAAEGPYQQLYASQF